MHPVAVPITVYVVVVVGLAITDEPVVLLNPVAGLHEYVLAPFTVNVADCPEQRVGSGETVSVIDRKSTRLNSSHSRASRMPSSA